MKTHTLKVNHEYMDALKSGEKPFEVRRDDRGFQKGDKLILCRHGWSGEGVFRSNGYMNAEGEVISAYVNNGNVDKIERIVSYVLTGGQFGIEPGFVVIGLQEPRP